MEMIKINRLGIDNESCGKSVQKAQFNNYNQVVTILEDSSNDDNADSSFPICNDIEGIGRHISHREMAIDCPASFIGGRKEPPRYPRPLSLIHNSTGNSQTSLSTPKILNEHTKFVHVVKIKDSREELLPYHHPDRIRLYQDDILKKREQEERLKKENEFLRTSLRGSKKLQDLEVTKRKSVEMTRDLLGIVNSNYLVDDEPEDSCSPLPYNGNDDRFNPNQCGLQQIILAVEKTQKYLRHPDDQREIERLQRFVVNAKFQNLLMLHKKVIDVFLVIGRDEAINHNLMVNSTYQPLNSLGSISALDLSCRILCGLTARITDVEAQELHALLNAIHIKNLLLAYDKASKLKLDFVKSSANEDEREYLYERASQYCEDSIKIVRLQKTADPLGATVRSDGESVIIGRIVRGGTAAKSGLLHEGDEILEINGIDIRGKSINDVCDLMSSLSGVLTFLINPCPEHRTSKCSQSVMHVRAHFTYDPEEDHYIPCRELGISFLKGDILHVINQDDNHWWQAYREGEDDQTLAGLIPSKIFQQQREALKQLIIGDAKDDEINKNRCHCTYKRHKKRQKLCSSIEKGIDEILTYEEVALYYPQPNRKRPVVLIGPPNVGCQELRKLLMEHDVDRFAAAVPHTSRPPEAQGTDMQDYHFISRMEFEADIADGKFVEYGEYEKHFFGTSMEAIRKVVNSGKICILNFHPQALHSMKLSDLKPYFVFIAPPNIDRLKLMRQKQGIKLSDDELKAIIEKARDMEDGYGHYFDMIIVNQDLDRAYDELLAEINRLELEPQWVSIAWVT